MSLRSRVIAAAAALTMIAGAGTAAAMTAGTAGAATPSCGFNCIEVFNQQFGEQFYQDVFRQKLAVGQPLILFRGTDSDPALDFAPTLLADVSRHKPLTVKMLCKSAPAMMGAGTCLRYSSDPAWESQYSPYGVDSGLCAGVAAEVNNEAVTLQPCGVTAKTWWISDNAHSYLHNGHWYTPWVSAASGNYTQPLVLTYPAGGYPTDVPRPALFISAQRTFSTTAPYQQQMWGVCFGDVGITC